MSQGCQKSVPSENKCLQGCPKKLCFGKCRKRCHVKNKVSKRCREGIEKVQKMCPGQKKVSERCRKGVEQKGVDKNRCRNRYTGFVGPQKGCPQDTFYNISSQKGISGTLLQENFGRVASGTCKNDKVALSKTHRKGIIGPHCLRGS